MISQKDLEKHLKELLSVDSINDYCPNGLQVSGKQAIKKIISGVTCAKSLIDEAIKEKADAIIVHHGFFWRGESPNLIGTKRERICLLLENNINCFAYHLPLDIHESLGNNQQLAEKFSWRVTNKHEIDGIKDLIFEGELPTSMTADEFSNKLKTILGQNPIYLSGTNKDIQKIAWCTGAAHRYLEFAADLGVDAYITGEVSESTYHIAKECGIHFFACGHHATERYGVQALGEYLAEKFSLEHKYVEINNPI